MDDKRNLLAFFIVAALILFGWPLVQSRILPPANPPVTRVVDNRSVPVVQADTGAVVRPAQRRELAAALHDSPRVAIATPKLAGSINLQGARIDDLVLLTYRQTIEPNSPPVRLFSPDGTAHSFFAVAGWSAPAGVVVPTSQTIWQAPAGARLTPTTPVTLTWDNGVGQRFELTYAVDPDFMFSVTQRVTNYGATPVSIGARALVNRAEPSLDPDTWTIHTGAIGVMDGGANYINVKDITEAPNQTLRYQTTGGWVGFTDKYWLGAVIPNQRVASSISVRHNADQTYLADSSNAVTALAPGQVRTDTQRIFAGAKETRLLDRYTDQGVILLDHATDWGWFIWFAKPIFYLLDWLFNYIGNFGFAIMALTLIIRLLMFPVAQRQFTSAAQMRLVQPKIKAMQEKYKDDKPRQQQEMMKLYKDEKINPLAGCLPVLIQIPVFYALYKCLMLTVEMRHQPFIGWIHDLSAPDPKHILNLFGYLNFTPPGFLSIGVLAVILGVTMYFQFKLNPPSPDPVQAQVFAIMPWMMMFIMAPFAAGLLVYWITNNILTIAQQQLLNLRHPGLRQMATTK